MLHLALAKNPWQIGNEKWGEIQKRVVNEFGTHISARGIKDRIDLLFEQYKSQQLKSRTGTVEEKSERGRLPESINVIVEEEKAAINILLAFSTLPIHYKFLEY